MSIATPAPVPAEIDYPESDGRPMADNTLHWQWMATIKENLEILFRDRDDVFVAGDLLWYPSEGDNTVRAAPDALVAIGRPKGHRGSYRQWSEGGIAPQVVFEVLSPSNRSGELVSKVLFYERHGVEECYIYDPDARELAGLLRRGSQLESIADMRGWRSPRLGIRFEPGDGDLKIYRPDGRPFLTYLELSRAAEQAEEQMREATARAEQEAARAEQEAARAEQEAARAEQEAARANALERQLRALGVKPVA